MKKCLRRQATWAEIREAPLSAAIWGDDDRDCLSTPRHPGAFTSIVRWPQMHSAMLCALPVRWGGPVFNCSIPHRFLWSNISIVLPTRPLLSVRSIASCAATIVTSVKHRRTGISTSPAHGCSAGFGAQLCRDNKIDQLKRPFLQVAFQSDGEGCSRRCSARLSKPECWPSGHARGAVRLYP